MIRPIEKEDLKKICELEVLCFQDAWSLDELKEEWSHSYSYGFILDEIAYVWIWELYENCEIVRIAVNPDQRGQGYGIRLMDFVCEHAKEHQCQQVILEVRISNQSAISLYEKCGLTISHRSKNHYSNGEDAYVMIGTL